MCQATKSAGTLLYRIHADILLKEFHERRRISKCVTVHVCLHVSVMTLFCWCVSASFSYVLCLLMSVCIFQLCLLSVDVCLNLSVMSFICWCLSVSLSYVHCLLMSNMSLSVYVCIYVPGTVSFIYVIVCWCLSVSFSSIHKRFMHFCECCSLLLSLPAMVWLICAKIGGIAN